MIFHFHYSAQYFINIIRIYNVWQVFNRFPAENEVKLGQLQSGTQRAFVVALDYTGFTLIIMRNVLKNPFP